MVWVFWGVPAPATYKSCSRQPTHSNMHCNCVALHLCVSRSIWSSYQEINPVDALSVQSEKVPPHFLSYSLHLLTLLSPIMCWLPRSFSTVSQSLPSLALFHLSPCPCLLVCGCVQRSSCPQQMETFTKIGLGAVMQVRTPAHISKFATRKNVSQRQAHTLTK